MLRRLRQTRVTFGFAVLYALAMVTLGFAHQPLKIAAPDAQLAAYALPDGTLAPICAHADGQPQERHIATHGCEACALSAAPGLACAREASAYVPTVRRIALAAPEQAQHAPLARHAPSSRGPPRA